jgi:transcriptional regulator with XRE-family HTH domain
LAQAQKRTTKRRQVHPAFGPEKALGQALREIREEKGISQERLALDAGFDRTFVSLLERGLRSPTMRTVVKLAEVLKVKPSEIALGMEAHLVKGRRRLSADSAAKHASPKHEG